MAGLTGLKIPDDQTYLRNPLTHQENLEAAKSKIFKDSVMEPGFIESLTAPEGSPIDYDNISSTVGGRLRETFVDPMRRFGGAIDKGVTGKPLTIGDQLSLIEGMIDTTVGGLFQHGMSKGGFDPNTLHMFVGPKAKDIVKAEAMVMRGASPAEIQSKLLMHKKPDGMWRQEISDAPMTLDPANLEVKYPEYPDFKHAQIGDVVKHPELMDQYPGIKESSFQLGEDVSGVQERGSWMDGVLSVYQDSPASRLGREKSTAGQYTDEFIDKMSRELVEDGDAPDYETAKKWMETARDKHIAKSQVADKFEPGVPGVVGHELQHAVQQKEGWARGGSPEMFNQADEADLARDALSFRKELDKQPKGLDPINKENNVVQAYHDSGIQEYLPSREARNLAHDRNNNPDDQLQELVNLYQLDKKTSPAKPFDIYQNLLGEREARDTASRLGLDLEQRRGLLPDLGEGAQVLMRGSGGTQASYPVYQGRSKKGLGDFMNPDKVAWGTTDRGTAEQFADVKESYFPYRKPPETVREMRGEVYDLDFDIKKPMDVDISETLWSREKELAKIAEAKAKGFDGLRINHPSGKIDYVAFDKSQISRVNR